MYKIYIDTTKRYEKKVALLKNGKEVDAIKGDVDTVASIRDILGRNSLELKDISKFESNPGPGSFTGIKIGITVANVLYWVLGKKKIEGLAKPEYGGKPNIQKKLVLFLFLPFF